MSNPDDMDNLNLVTPTLPEDCRNALRKAKWIEDFGLDERLEAAQYPDATGDQRRAADADRCDIEAIEGALAAYYWAPKQKSLTAARREAAKLLDDLEESVKALLSALKEAEGNPYVSSAIFAALGSENQDERIFEYGDAAEKVAKLAEKLAPIYAAAAAGKEYSDALPQAQRGGQKDDELGGLILTLQMHIGRIAGRVPDSNWKSPDIARAIAETLQCLKPEQTAKAIEHRIKDGDYQDLLLVRSGITPA